MAHLRGDPQAYWDRMRALSRTRDGFTIGEVLDKFRAADMRTVQHYVRSLVRVGAVAAIGERRTERNRVARLYRVNLNAAVDPVARACALPAQPGRVQQQIWTAMRGMGGFTPHELAVQASTDEIGVTRAVARDYANALAVAGYLQELAPRQGRKPAVMRLKPGMNTGPVPPAVLSAGGVLDRNRNQVFGGGEL